MNHLQLALRESAYRLSQAVAVAGTLAVAVFMSLTIYTLSDAYLRAVSIPFQNLGSDLVLQRSVGSSPAGPHGQGAFLPVDAQPFTAAEVAAIGQTAGVQAASGSLIFWSADEAAVRLAVGVDPTADFGAGSIREHVKAGRFFEPGDTGTAIVDEHYAAFYLVEVGQSVVTVGGRPFAIIGIARPPAAGNLSAVAIFVPLADAQELLGLPPTAVNTLDLQAAPGASVAAVQADLTGRIPGLRPASAQSLAAASGTLTGYAARFAHLFLGLIAAVAAFVIYLTVAGSVREGATQIAILKTLGWTLPDLRKQIGLQVLLQSIGGSLLGILLWLGAIPVLRSIRIEDRQAAQWVSGISGSDGFHGHVPSVALSLRMSPLAAAGVVALAMAVALVTAFLVTRRLAALKPTMLLGQHK